MDNTHTPSVERVPRVLTRFKSRTHVVVTLHRRTLFFFIVTLVEELSLFVLLPSFLLILPSLKCSAA